HVRRHQRRRGGARRALRLDHQPQFPRAAGTARAHPSDVSGHGRGGGGDRKTDRRAAAAPRAEGVRRRAKLIELTAADRPPDVAELNPDQLRPARFLKVPRSAGLATALLRDLRFDADGRERPDFPLNRAAWRDAEIVVGGRNFGCGSSREAAVYALWDYGI